MARLGYVGSPFIHARSAALKLIANRFFPCHVSPCSFYRKDLPPPDEILVSGTCPRRSLSSTQRIPNPAARYRLRTAVRVPIVYRTTFPMSRSATCAMAAARSFFPAPSPRSRAIRTLPASAPGLASALYVQPNVTGLTIWLVSPVTRTADQM